MLWSTVMCPKCTWVTVSCIDLRLINIQTLTNNVCMCATVVWDQITQCNVLFMIKLARCMSNKIFLLYCYIGTGHLYAPCHNDHSRLTKMSFLCIL